MQPRRTGRDDLSIRESYKRLWCMIEMKVGIGLGSSEGMRYGVGEKKKWGDAGNEVSFE